MDEVDEQGRGQARPPDQVVPVRMGTGNDWLTCVVFTACMQTPMYSAPQLDLNFCQELISALRRGCSPHAAQDLAFARISFGYDRSSHIASSKSIWATRSDSAKIVIATGNKADFHASVPDLLVQFSHRTRVCIQLSSHSILGRVPVLFKPQNLQLSLKVQTASAMPHGSLARTSCDAIDFRFRSVAPAAVFFCEWSSARARWKIGSHDSTGSGYCCETDSQSDGWDGASSD